MYYSHRKEGRLEKQKWVLLRGIVTEPVAQVCGCRHRHSAPSQSYIDHHSIWHINQSNDKFYQKSMNSFPRVLSLVKKRDSRLSSFLSYILFCFSEKTCQVPIFTAYVASIPDDIPTQYWKNHEKLLFHVSWEICWGRLCASAASAEDVWAGRLGHTTPDDLSGNLVRLGRRLPQRKVADEQRQESGCF